MQAIWHDLRYAFRQLRRSPGFTLTVVLTLALGVGANAAVFSLLNQALLRSLPVRDPTQLVILEGTGKQWEGHTSSFGTGPEESFSYPAYRELRDENHAFQGLLATSPAQVNFVRGQFTDVKDAELVSGNYFQLLGVQAALGRTLMSADDTAPDANPVVVLSYAFWRDQLGADPTVLGSTVSLNTHPYQIIGVAAPGFRSAAWGDAPALFVPMSMLDQILPGKSKRFSDQTDRWLNVVGRLEPGETRAQAQVALAPLWHGLRAEELRFLGHQSFSFVEDFLTRSRLLVHPGARGLSYSSRAYYQDPLIAAMAMAVLVLVIATTNVGSLLLVRAAGRMPEFALRYALGASRLRIMLQLLLEGLLLGAAGVSAGLLLAPAALRVIVGRIQGTDADGPFSPALDMHVLLSSLVAALGVSLVLSLIPAVQLRRAQPSLAMRQVAAAGGVRLNLRRVVVSLQIGFSVLLLVGASLFVRSLIKLHSADTGFDTQQLLTFTISPTLAGYPLETQTALQQAVSDRLATLPGVLSVAAADGRVFSRSSHFGNVTVAGYTPVNQADIDLDVQKSAISPTYLSTLHIPLLAGRTFTQMDDENHPHVAVVNQAFVRHFCAGSIPRCLGALMQDGRHTSRPLDVQIVGVVRDTKRRDLRETPEPTWFQPLSQVKDPGRLTFYVRVVTATQETAARVRQAMQQLAPSLALSNFESVSEQIDESLKNDSLVTMLSVSFGALALSLAGVGIYGVLAYTATQRTREIGIRIALGSPRAAILQLVLGEALRLTAIGIMLSLPIAFTLARLLRSQLFGISPADPLSFSLAVLLIFAAALTAALVPARRAVSVNPVEALRAE